MNPSEIWSIIGPLSSAAAKQCDPGFPTALWSPAVAAVLSPS
jgi:hypothetical protein